MAILIQFYTSSNIMINSTDLAKHSRIDLNTKLYDENY